MVPSSTNDPVEVVRAPRSDPVRVDVASAAPPRGQASNTKSTSAQPRHAASSGRGEPDEQAEPPRFRMLKRVGMAAATAFVTVNIWTGAPLVALWAGSQVVGEQRLTMGAVGVVVGVLAVLVLSLAAALTWLNGVYDRLIGRPRGEPRATWLRAMNVYPERHMSQRVGITMLEKIVMINVYIVVIGFVVWYFFFAPHICVREC
jgi:hypothetical protein